MFPMIFNTECTLGYNLGKKQHLVSKIPHAEDLLYVGDFFFFFNYYLKKQNKDIQKENGELCLLELFQSSRRSKLLQHRVILD